MTEVKIENFQSIGKASFEVKGFTVVVGKNNLGKSAIVRAIDSALTNQIGKEFIRYGENGCSVSIKNEDLDVLWEKGSSATYKVNGKVYSKLNRAVPEPILEAGFRRLEIGDQKLNPLVAKQFDELFLVDKPGSTITEVLSTIYKLNILSTADDLCQKELKSQKSLLKTRDKDLLALETRLEQYKDLDKIKKGVSELWKKKEECDRIRDKIREVQDYQERIEVLKDRVAVLKEVCSTKIPDSAPLAKKVSDFSWMQEIHGTIVKTITSVRSMQEVVGIDIPDVKGTDRKAKTLEQVSILHSSLKETAQNAKTHRDMLSELGVLEDVLLPGVQRIQFLVDETERTGKLAEEFLALARSLKAMKSELSAANTELEKLEKEKAEYKICPLCSKPL